MNKFRKHITKRKLLNKRKRIHRRTVKKTKGGMDLYKTLVGLLILANGTQAFQNRPHVGHGIKTKPVLPPPPRLPPTMHLKIGDSDDDPNNNEQIFDKASEDIGNKIKQGALEDFVKAKVEEIVKEKADGLFEQSIKDIVDDIKRGKKNKEAGKLIHLVGEQIG
jgi:hypothetical protein